MEIAIILNSGVPVKREITADKIICADGGYRLCPVRPDYLVGDLDSLGSAPQGIPLLRHDSHKNFSSAARPKAYRCSTTTRTRISRTESPRCLLPRSSAPTSSPCTA